MDDLIELSAEETARKITTHMILTEGTMSERPIYAALDMAIPFLIEAGIVFAKKVTQS